MSIRPEHAAREAGRFSLRKAFLGRTDVDAPQQNPQEATLIHNAQAPATLLNVGAPFQQTRFVPTTAGPCVFDQRPVGFQNKGLTFGSIVGHKTGCGAAAKEPPTQTDGMSSTAIEAMRKISEMQKNGAMGQHDTFRAERMLKSVHLEGKGNGFTRDRVLSSGYINGGTTQTDASAEVMRLTCLVDSMNGKIAMQSERLQRTEASLIKANQAMTSERAIHNGRMLKMKSDVKELKTSEAMIRDKLSYHTESKAKETASFEYAVSVSEKIDEKMQAYEARIAELTSQLSELHSANLNSKQVSDVSKAERDDICTRLASEKERSRELDKMLLVVAEERDNAVASSAAAKSAEVQLELEQKLLQITSKYDELLEETALGTRESEKLETSERDAHSALVVEKGELLLQLAAMTSKRDEALKVVESLTNDVFTQTNNANVSDAAAKSAMSKLELLSKRVEANQSLQATGCGYDAEVDADFLPKRPHVDSHLKYEQTQGDRTETGQFDAFEDDPYDLREDGTLNAYNDKHAYGSSYHCREFYNGIGHKTHAQMPTRLFVESDTLHKRERGVGAFKSTLHSLFDENERSNPVVARAIPPWAESKLCTSSSIVSLARGHRIDTAVLTGTSSDAHEGAMQAKIQKLVHAVSADITRVVLQQRRVYLSASGMGLNEIEGDIGALTSTTE